LATLLREGVGNGEAYFGVFLFGVGEAEIGEDIAGAF
jgi:hypothetical protein